MTFRINEDEGVSRIQLEIPVNMLIYASVGGGKSHLAEQIANFHYRKGFTVISLSDVKGTFEQAFSMFEPEAPYHLRKLRKFGCPIQAVPTKIYHPFTFKIPDHSLPPINFYTINIKNLNRTDLNFLAETAENKRSIQILLEQVEALKKTEGLHHLAFYADEKTESDVNIGNTKIRLRSDNPDDLFSRTKMGTEKTSSEINSYLKPFNKEYCILPANCPHNIDIVQIMNDQKHYHIFSQKWIKDEREKAFHILHILLEIISHADQAKHPICIYTEEITFLLPDTNEGFTAYLSDYFKKTLLSFRSMGKGFSSILVTQSFRATNQNVIDSCNETVIGRVSSLKEIESISKALRFTTQEVNLLKSLDVGEFCIKTIDQFTDEPNYSKMKPFLTPTAHKEIYDNFFQKYEQKHPDRMQTYKELKQDIQARKQAVIESVSILKDAENQKKRDTIKREQENRQTKEKTKIQTETAKVLIKTAKAEATDHKIKELIYQDYINTVPRPSLSQLANKYHILLSDGTPNKTGIKRIITQITKQRNKQDNDTNNSQNNTQN